MSKRKTYKKWDESGKDLNDFLQPMDEIDEDLFLHLLEIVPAYFCMPGIGQCGEPMRIDDFGIWWRETVIRAYDKYYYLGALPEFKTPTND